MAMDYKLKDLLDIPKLRLLLDSLDEIHSMPSAIIDTEGIVLTANAWQDICTKFHRVNPETEKKCIESDRQIEARLDKKDPHVVYRCHMGLVDSAIPIIIEGKHIGNVFTGQLFMDPPDKAYFVKQAAQYGFDEDDYLAAMRKVPFFTEEKLHKNLTFIHALTQMLAEQGLHQKRQSEAEASLRASEAIFRRLFEDVNDPILLLKNGRFVDCNSATLHLLGYDSKPDFINRSPFEISPEIQPDGRNSEEKAVEMIAIAYQAGYHRFEWMHSRADGSDIPVEVTLTPITVDGKDILHTLWRDITDLKRSEKALLAIKDELQEQNEELQVADEALREQNNQLLATEEMLRVQIEEYEFTMKLLKESEERFRSLSNASFGGIIIHDKGLILECNEGLSDMTGFSIEELIGMDGLKLIAPESLETVISNIQRKYEHRYEVIGVCKDGSKYPLAIRGKNVFYKGKDVRVIEFRDISEIKPSQKALMASEELFRSFVENANDIVFSLTKDGIFKYLSPKWKEALGHEISDAIGKSFEPYVHPDDLAACHAFLKRVMETDEKQSDFEFRVSHNSGGWIWFSANASVIRDAEGDNASFIGIARDITEQKQRENEQLKIEKLESLGVLAGGIAHDFNNILSGIMGNISFAQMFLDPAHKSYKPIVEAEKASVRATELAYQLLTFARGGEPIKKVVSLKDIIAESMSLVLHGSNVKAVIDIPDSIHAIEADEGQMSQVFHNIIINATQAMPGGGALTTAAQNVTLADGNPLSLSRGLYVCLKFTDQGCGIPDELLKKIFDPYFTTKSAGNGLGLASARSIISKHGGHIGAASKQGSGTTFTIYLPSIGETYSHYQTASDTRSTENHTGGIILVMDDEKIIREMTTEMLEYMGYQVVTCGDGKDALILYKSAIESGTPFSAVIMDLTIPGGMGGKAAARQIIDIDPKACLIVSSGYSNDPIMSEYSKYGFSGAVAKPYKMIEFGQILSAALAK